MRSASPCSIAFGILVFASPPSSTHEGRAVPALPLNYPRALVKYIGPTTGLDIESGYDVDAAEGRGSCVIHKRGAAKTEIKDDAIDRRTDWSAHNSYSELFNESHLEVEAGLGLGLFSASAAFQMMNSFKVSSESWALRGMAYVEYDWQKYVLSGDDNPDDREVFVLRDFAKTMLDNQQFEDFRFACGTHFISRVTHGGQLEVVFVSNTVDAEKRSEFNHQAQVSSTAGQLREESRGSTFSKLNSLDVQKFTMGGGGTVAALPEVQTLGELDKALNTFGVGNEGLKRTTYRIRLVRYDTLYQTVNPEGTPVSEQYEAASNYLQKQAEYIGAVKFFAQNPQLQFNLYDPTQFNADIGKLETQFQDDRKVVVNCWKTNACTSEILRKIGEKTSLLPPNPTRPTEYPVTSTRSGSQIIIPKTDSKRRVALTFRGKWGNSPQGTFRAVAPEVGIQPGDRQGNCWDDNDCWANILVVEDPNGIWQEGRLSFRDYRFILVPTGARVSFQVDPRFGDIVRNHDIPDHPGSGPNALPIIEHPRVYGFVPVLPEVLEALDCSKYFPGRPGCEPREPPANPQ